MRHGWIGAEATYNDISRLFAGRLSRDAALYNEYHALIVALGKNLCRPKPRCAECPLQPLLPGRRSALNEPSRNSALDDSDAGPCRFGSGMGRLFRNQRA